LLAGFDEDWVLEQRDLVRRLAAAGDRAAAVAAYERFRARLASELRIVPSAATRALVDELRAEPAATRPEVGPSAIRYAPSGAGSIAYQRFGSGPAELVVVPGWASNLDEIWGFPPLGPMLSRLGEFARCVVFDKRGTGLSDRELGFGSLEERADDIRAVMDAAGVQRASLFGYSESAALAIVFAAAHPDRVESLVLYSAYARLLAPGYEGGLDPAIVDASVAAIARGWGAGRISHISIQGIPASAGRPRRSRAGSGASARRRWRPTSSAATPTSTCARSCRGCRCRRSSCTATRRPRWGATSRTGSPGRATSNTTRCTTCRGMAAAPGSSRRSRTSCRGDLRHRAQVPPHVPHRGVSLRRCAGG